MRKRFFFYIFIVLITSTVSAQSVKFPSYRGWVNDFARVISPYYEEKISLLAGEVKRKTGAEIAIVTVNNLSGLSVEEYAYRLLEEWGIGTAKDNNGLLLLVAVEERRFRIEVGYGLEGILPDGLAGQIRDDFVLPDLREGDYGRGLYRGMIGVSQVIAKDAGVQVSERQRPVRRSRSRQRRSGGGFFFIIMIILMIVTKGRIIPWLFLGMMMGGGGGRSGGFGGGSFGGGFGGFGGGMSGGGGASGSF